MVRVVAWAKVRSKLKNSVNRMKVFMKEIENIESFYGTFRFTH